MRKYNTGATRDSADDKLVYTGFLSPEVLRRYAQYMHKNRIQKDGSLREADNWKKGIPKQDYLESLGRHWMDVWLNHEGFDTGVDQEDALCAMFFNIQGMLDVILKEKVRKQNE